LARRCHPDSLPFETTQQLDTLGEIIGQDRAVEAIRFGLSIDRPGFNVFAFGPSGHGRLTTIRHFLAHEARERGAPDGWCYVHGFTDSRRPAALRLPPGRCTELRTALHDVVEELLERLPAAFESDDYAARRHEIAEQRYGQALDVFSAVAAEAERRGLELARDGESWQLEPAEGDAPSGEPAPDRQQAQRELQPELERAVNASRALARQSRHDLSALEVHVASTVVGPRFQELCRTFQDLPAVTEYLRLAEADVLGHLELFERRQSRAEESDGDGPDRADASARARRRRDARLRRYDVNVLVDHDPAGGAPVVTEWHPTLANLVGSCGHEEREGSRRTDFTMLQPGALHRANGGYLIMEAAGLLQQAHSWDTLKRALRTDRIRMESAGDDGKAGALDPEPIPLCVKVILVGEPYQYYHLDDVDGEFAELFKVGAEFGGTMPRDAANELLYARFVATVAGREGLRPLDRPAVARVIEHSSRLTEDAQRLSADFRSISDVLREADYWAAGKGRSVVGVEDVERALAARERRFDRVREELYDNLARDVVQVATRGTNVGTVNALTVVDQAGFAFGLPARVSARVRMGGGEVLDIEREVDLGGPLHSKGVLILSGFLGGRYLPDEPLAMAASLTFEQSHGPIDGDSASLAELVAILSELAAVAVRQEIAVSGSLSQRGTVQAVGAVSEKVEGFYDVCALHGLTGSQGVVVPTVNVQHLMLRDDVVEAVRQGRFHIYAVGHVDEAIPLLCGLEAGQRGSDGLFPEGSFNRLVEDRLGSLAERRRELGHAPDGPEDGAAPDNDGAGRRRPRRPSELPR